MSGLFTITGTTTEQVVFFETHIVPTQWWPEQLQVITADSQQLLLVCGEHSVITQMNIL